MDITVYETMVGHTRNKIFNIYLHQIIRSDDDRALHDHPYSVTYL